MMALSASVSSLGNDCGWVILKSGARPKYYSQPTPDGDGMKMEASAPANAE